MRNGIRLMANNSMNIVITHGYTDSNKGDAAIALGTIAAIRRALPNATISSHSNYSEKHVAFKAHSRFVRQTGIPIVEGILPSPYLEDRGAGIKRDIAAGFRLVYELLCLTVLWFLPMLAPLHPRKAYALCELKQASLVIARGGQYLHNESGRIRGMIYLCRMLLNIAIPIWLNKPTIVLGLSFGPVHGDVARWMVRTTIRACRYVVVREALSADFLRTLGISSNVLTAPDLAFLTVPSKTPTVCSMLPKRHHIAVTAINWSFPGHNRPQQALENYVDAVFDTLVKCHIQYGLTPVLVMQVTAQHHGQHDYPVITGLYERLRSAGVPAHLVSEDLTPGELVFLYGQCDLVLATRLHSIILAACGGTPSVAIRYQGFKTQGIMNELGLEEHTHDINSLSSEALLNSISQVLAHRESLSAGIRSRVDRYHQEIPTVIDTIAATAIEPPPLSRAQQFQPMISDGRH